MIAPATPPATPALRLRDALLWRLGAVALAVVLGLGWSDWRDWRQRVVEGLPATTTLVTQLLNDDLSRRTDSFSRADLSASLMPLATLGQRVAFCAEVRDINNKVLAAGCLPARGSPPDAADRLAVWLGTVNLDDALLPHTPPQTTPDAGLLTLPAGLKVGHVSVRPHWAHEGRLLWPRWQVLAAAAAALLLMLALASRLVARALAPANQVLQALARLSAGDLAVRLPPLPLQELDRIGEGFNRMAEHQSQVHQAQRQLAHHLLQAREAERRRLARELHDEMGQSLAALQAEAAAMALIATPALPQAAACAQAMGRTSAQLLEGLQRVLADLRPQALDRFGLAVALESLVGQARRRSDGSALQARLHMPASWPELPPDHDVHVYRIVQEALTNAWRHGRARHADVSLRQDAGRLRLEVIDDGTGPGTANPEPGHGLLGLRERVLALSGEVGWDAPPAGGWRLRVTLPLQQGLANEVLADPADAGPAMPAQALANPEGGPR